MNSRRRPVLLAPVFLAFTLALTACIQAPPGPVATPEPVDTVQLEDSLLDILPTELPDGLDEVRSTGLQDETFGSGFGDWTGAEHDDKRLARAQGSYLSEGWNDPTLGPGYHAVIELAVMESERAADAAMQNIAASAKEDSTIEATEATPEIEYRVPPSRIRPEFPNGSVEWELRMLWSTGERTSGWINYTSSGPYILVAWGTAVPYEGSEEAMDAYFDGVLPDLVSKFVELPD